MDRDPEKRPAWRRLPVQLGAIVLTAAVTATVTWAVTRGLDEGSESLNDDPPIRISVEDDPARVYAPNDPGWQTYGFISERTRDQLGRPPSPLCREWRTWALGRGGVDADKTRLYVFLQGKPNTAVVITGLEVDFTRRSRPVSGTHAWCPTGGAAPSPNVADVDLDTKPPTIRYARAGDDFPGRRRLHLTLNGTETETVELTAHTRRCDCEWRARVFMVVDGEKHEQVIDDGGRPFRTSASGRSSHVQWDGKRWATMSRAEWKQTLPLSPAELAP
jgi:hypothetical protein